MLLPVLGFADMAFMRFSLVADHFQYAAMIGVIAFAAALLGRLAEAAGWRGFAGKFAAAGCVAVLAGLTWPRAGLYGDEERLWKDNLAKSPAPIAARLAWRHLGDTYVRAGRYGEALDSFDRCIALEPGSADAYYDRAAVYSDLGRYDRAIGDYDKVIALYPNSAAGYNNRGNACAAAGRLQDAVRDYEKAMALEPRSALPWFNRGNARRQSGAPLKRSRISPRRSRSGRSTRRRTTTARRPISSFGNTPGPARISKCARGSAAGPTRRWCRRWRQPPNREIPDNRRFSGPATPVVDHGRPPPASFRPALIGQ